MSLSIWKLLCDYGARERQRNESLGNFAGTRHLYLNTFLYFSVVFWVGMPPDDSTSGGPDMNKFEQVKSDCHQMSLGNQGQGWGSHVQKDWAGGACTVSPNASWIMVTQTHTTKNIIFQQFHSRAVKNL